MREMCENVRCLSLIVKTKVKVLCQCANFVNWSYILADLFVYPSCWDIESAL